MPIAFRHEPRVTYGVVQTLSPLIRRIVANNGGPFTYYGTGTYVLGHGRVAIVDPGPALAEHVDALLSALAANDETVSHQLITHTHNDHSPAARLVRERTGAPTYGFGPHGLGQYERGSTVEAGADMAFEPDVRLGDGDTVDGDGWSVTCVHTPGHCSNHLCYSIGQERTLLTGDHVMGWSTSVISPPDGDMGDYMASLERLLERDDRTYLPAHGPAVTETEPFVRSLIEHRRERERQILSCLAQGIGRISDMVPRMYAGTDKILYPAAARSVFAHVIHMLERGMLACDVPTPALGASYRLS
jgi:glyoxylase-like metal-dependent hydrolase (beta-lactamase superfamily II)